MPRGSNGVYTPPAGTTPVPNTLGDATKIAAYLADLGNEITGSLPTNGSAPMTGPLTLSGNATAALHAVALQQIQTGRAVQPGGLSTGAPGWTPEGFVSAQRLNIGGTYQGRLTFYNLSGVAIIESGIGVGTGFGDTYGVNITVPTGNYWFGVNGVKMLEIDSLGGVFIAKKLTTGTTGYGASLAIKPGTGNHCFIEFYARTADPNTRTGYVGYELPGNNVFTFNNGLGGFSFQIASTQIAYINAAGIGGNGSQLTGIDFGAGVAAIPLQGVGLPVTVLEGQGKTVGENVLGSFPLPNGGTWRCENSHIFTPATNVTLWCNTFKRIA